ncbi:NAD(P)/FAD-dependent oxidoreductase [Fusibacter sp. 3D3]|uniref:NAD(P)/FAD-dependent oxidoreductase n=1 Tax=Fusibacter sp. 3D3 TaxID=1048380 RepID=UPI00085387D4|nr:NAD(P)/FAD-dependent oxidoreductase [Fusibacter sp. 3D3]GAU75602.1 2,4-dienoyl-CoA reductase [NADPH] [Fusibacter sp. 3D3]
MTRKKYINMFSPMQIKNVTFKNRVFASPLTTNRIVEHGYPTAEGIDEYENRSRGGFAVVTLTESFIDDDYSSRHEHGLNVYKKQMSTIHIESILTLTEAIKAHGAVASIQLNHVGAMNHPEEIKGKKNPIGPSAFLREDGVQVDEMTVEMMEEVANNWAEAAWNCKAMGFEMVNLHGGHGWLLNQFISPRFNKRLDEYGGSMENRARFPIMVCKRIKEVCGDDFLIEYRMSGSERIEGGMTLTDGIEFAKIIQHHVDLIHVTSGVYQDHVNTKAFSSMFDKHGCNLDLAEAIKKNVNVPVVAVGGFNSPEQIEDAIATGKCDFVALGRQQFADPAFVNKTLAGCENQIAPCLRCSCFNPLSGNPEERPIPELWHCAVNPWASRELRWRSAPKPLGKRKVLIIGGGVSGMYAALTAAERGHDVTLCEKESELGGQLWFTEIDEHKESLKRYKDSLIERCKSTGVNIHLGTEATMAFADELKPDVVICAVGAQPFTPPIKGIEHATYAVAVYKNPESYFNKKVVIIGGGAIGCETGYFLADIHNTKVKILEARDDISKDSNESQRMALFPRMKEAGMTWDCNTKILEIKDSGVLYIDAFGNERLEEADVVLFATGSRSNTDIVEKYREISPKFIVTGDARKARTVKQATYEGFCAAMDIL